MCHTLKVFLRIILNRIRNKCEKDLEDTQFGFGTRDASTICAQHTCRDQRIRLLCRVR